MSPLLTVMVLCGAAPAATAAPGGGLLLSEWVERIKLPVQHLTIRADPWRSQFELTSELSGQALLKAFPKGAARTCPKRAAEGKSLVLTCESSRLVALASAEGGGTVIELSLARGLPWRELGNPALRWSYPPERFGLGTACPGSSTPEGLVECHIGQGATAAQVEKELQGIKGAMASIRAGDLALARQDVTAAMSAWEQVGRIGLLARLARVRLCELSGACLGSDEEATTFDTSVLPEPARTEFELRHARLLTLFGRRAEAAALLNDRLADISRPDACAQWPEVCDGVTIAALSSDQGSLQAVGLELFLRRPRPQVDLKLARQAADASARLGAPAFGANLLAAATRSVKGDELEPHLRRVIELYEAARDPVRAAVVREYAESIFKRRSGKRAVAPNGDDEAQAPGPSPRMVALEDEVQRELELANAISSVSRARSTGP